MTFPTAPASSTTSLSPSSVSTIHVGSSRPASSHATNPVNFSASPAARTSRASSPSTSTRVPSIPSSNTSAPSPSGGAVTVKPCSSPPGRFSHHSARPARAKSTRWRHSPNASTAPPERHGPSSGHAASATTRSSSRPHARNATRTSPPPARGVPARPRALKVPRRSWARLVRRNWFPWTCGAYSPAAIPAWAAVDQLTAAGATGGATSGAQAGRATNTPSHCEHPCGTSGPGDSTPSEACRRRKSALRRRSSRHAGPGRWECARGIAPCGAPAVAP